MLALIGIPIMIIGVAFPMSMLVWLNGRMRRQPALQPRQVGMILALNGILPLGLVLAGLSLIYPPFGASLVIRAILVTCGLAVLGLFFGLWWTGRATERKGGSNAG